MWRRGPGQVGGVFLLGCPLRARRRERMATGEKSAREGDRDMATSYLQTLRLFSRDVRLYMIAAAVFGFTVFGGIYGVLLNLYLLRLDYGPEFIGLVNSAMALAVAVLGLPAGALGKRWGIRRMMVAGMGATAIGFGLLPAAEYMPSTWQAGWIVASYVLAGLGIALYLVNANPFLMGRSSPKERSHVFSVQGAVLPLAGFAGSVVGGLLPGLFAALMGVSLDSAAPYRYPLLIAAVAVIPGMAALLATRETGDAYAEERVVETGAAPYGLIALLSLVVLLQVAGESTARTFFNVYLDDGLQVPTAQIGVLTAAGQLLAAPAALAAPLLMARWGKGRAFVWTSLGMAVSMLPLSLIPHWGAAGLGFIGMTALASVARPVITVFQQESVSPGWWSTVSGATTMAAGLSSAVAAFGGGYLITATGYGSLFLTGAGLTAAGALLFRATLGVRRGGLAGRFAPDRAD